jgi:hypothetical protein
LKFDLDPEQEALIERVVAEPTRAALQGSDRGTGKTVMGCEVAKRLGARTVLLICPLNTRDGWEATFTDREVGLPFYRIEAKNKPERNLELYEMLRTGVPGVYIIGREYFTLTGSDAAPKKCKEHKKIKCRLCPEVERRKALWSWRKVHPDLIIYDEVHAAQNRNGQTFGVLKGVKAGFKLGQSGTWHGNKFQGAWAITRWLWPDIIDPSFWRWAATWATTEVDPHVKTQTGEPGKKVTVERNPGAFANSLPCYVRLEGEELEVINRRVMVDLSPKQRTQYTQMETDMLTWLEDHPLVAELPIVQRTRLRQMSLGEVSLNAAGEVDFAPDCNSSKIDALEKIIAKHHPTEPVMIYCASQRFARVVAARIGGAEWSGSVPHAERERIKADFIAGKIKYIVATIPAIGEGVDGLQRVCNTEVWLEEMEGNAVMNLQAQGRLERRGQTKPIYRYRVLARDTYDEGVFGAGLSRVLAMRQTMRKEK